MGAELLGFWLPWQPRWLHIAPNVCWEAQRLLSTRAANGDRAVALSVIVHEMTHALGVRNEAQANCYAVQLVYFFAKKLKFTDRTTFRLERLALRYIPAGAPRAYSNGARCRDNGEWDLLEGIPNLSR